MARQVHGVMEEAQRLNRLTPLVVADPALTGRGVPLRRCMTQAGG